MENFAGLLRSEYTLDRWEGVFQLLKSGPILLLTQDVGMIFKGKLLPSKRPTLKMNGIITTTKSLIPGDLEATDVWLRSWL